MPHPAHISPQVNTFLDDNFLLLNEHAKILYHEYAANLPIIDYHCHLPPKEIAADKKFDNLTDIWLKGDHYKWRAMASQWDPGKIYHRFCQ